MDDDRPSQHQGLDVVYLVRDGDRNDELRHSLRSLSNLPHRTVWLAGFQPAWSVNVGRLPVPQTGGKWVNQAANLRAACTHPDVSDPFWLFNDDFYVIEPPSERWQIPRHRGLLCEFVSAKTSQTEWHIRLRDTCRLLGPNALSYDGTHTPLLVDKTKMLAVLDDIGDRYLFRSVYGNRWNIGGVQGCDAKIRHRDRQPDGALLSTSDRSFKMMPVGTWVRERFPTPCRYETVMSNASLAITVLTGGRPQLLARTLRSFYAHHRNVWDRAHRTVLHNSGDYETRHILSAYRWDRWDTTDRLLPIGEASGLLARQALESGRDVTLRLEDDWKAQPTGWEQAMLALDEVDQIRLRRSSERVSRRCAVCRVKTVWRHQGSLKVGHSHFTYNPTLIRTAMLDRVKDAVNEKDAMRLSHPLTVGQLVPGVFAHIGDQHSLRETVGAA